MTTTSKKLLEFFVPINPKPASRPRFRVCGRFAQAYTEPKYKAFMEEFESLLPEIEDTLTNYVDIECTFLVQKPKTTKLKFPKPDLDNFEKGVYDCITKKHIWSDDTLIVNHNNSKAWAEEGETRGVMVEIYEHDETKLQKKKNYISNYLTLFSNTSKK